MTFYLPGSDAMQAAASKRNGIAKPFNCNGDIPYYMLSTSCTPQIVNLDKYA
jgi:hypothetical protein